MPEQVIFGMEVFLNGLMAGVLYALVALGFVLIYKASGIFNYAQGVMALFAACLLYTSPSPRDRQKSRMPSSA